MTFRTTAQRVIIVVSIWQPVNRAPIDTPIDETIDTSLTGGDNIASPAHQPAAIFELARKNQKYRCNSRRFLWDDGFLFSWLS